MEWEKPEYTEISLTCEINGYASAELSAGISVKEIEMRPSNSR